MIKKVTSSIDEFKATINNDKVALVDFSAEWCGPCRMLEPILNEISGDLGDEIKVYKIDIDELPEAATEYTIRSLPTLLIFKDGTTVNKLHGLQTKEKILEAINQN